MKVIQAMVWWVFNCSNCGSKLEAEPVDADCGVFGTDYTGSGGIEKYFVTCPKCGQHNQISNDKLTPKIRQLAEQKRKDRQEKS